VTFKRIVVLKSDVDKKRGKEVKLNGQDVFRLRQVKVAAFKYAEPCSLHC